MNVVEEDILIPYTCSEYEAGTREAVVNVYTQKPEAFAQYCIYLTLLPCDVYCILNEPRISSHRGYLSSDQLFKENDTAAEIQIKSLAKQKTCLGSWTNVSDSGEDVNSWGWSLKISQSPQNSATPPPPDPLLQSRTPVGEAVLTDEDNRCCTLGLTARYFNNHLFNITPTL